MQPNFKSMKYAAALLIVIALASCNTNKDRVEDTDNDPSLTPATSGIAAPARISYSIISQFPHDTSSFTEGLELHNGKLYESGGEYTSSRLQYGNVKTGVVEKKNMMGSDKIFGEGITIIKDKIYQLTYQSNVGYVYDINNIDKPIKTFNWPYEGWGLTNNGTDLIINTGPPNIYFVDPETFKVKNTVVVMDNSGPVNEINEMEFIDGFIWANVWNTNRIVKIDPESGHVVGDMYLDNIAAKDGSLLTGAFSNTNVLNGIAYDSAAKTLLITGKRWPVLYELKVN